MPHIFCFVADSFVGIIQLLDILVRGIKKASSTVTLITESDPKIAARQDFLIYR